MYDIMINITCSICDNSKSWELFVYEKIQLLCLKNLHYSNSVSIKIDNHQCLGLGGKM